MEIPLLTALLLLIRFAAVATAPLSPAWHVEVSFPFTTFRPMDPILLPMVGALAGELVAETRGRERFATSPERDIWREAGTFARYRLASLVVTRQTDRDARRMSISDLWELDHRSSPEMQLLIQLLAHLSPQRLNPRNNAKDPIYEEDVLHERLKAYTADLSALGAFFRPNQLMANYVSRELARGKQQTPGIHLTLLPI